MAVREEQLIEVLGVLAEGVRFRILSLIASKGELTAKEILEGFDFTQPTLSHHMACLVKAGLVNVKRKGRYAYYSVNKDTIEMLSFEIASLKNPSKAVSVERKVKHKEEPVSEASGEKIKKGKKKKKKDKDKSKKKKKD